ncbi:MAG: SRPBCC domain-containing protein [Ignavibacteriales bacterium]
MKAIEKKVVINAPVSKVWEALTESGKIQEWMLMSNTFKPELNRDFVFNGEMNGNIFDIKCKVLELEKNKKLVYSWSAPFFEGDTKVSIHLKDVNSRTELTLTHSGFAENQKEVQESHSKGWEERFVEKLKALVEKK